MKLTIEGMSADELLTVLKGLRIREQQLRRIISFSNQDVIDAAFSTVLHITNVNKGLIKSTKRDSIVVRARYHVIRLIREFSSLSLVEIGNEVGGRDHSSVIHAIETHKNDCEFNQDYARQWLQVKQHMEDLVGNSEFTKELSLNHKSS